MTKQLFISLLCILFLVLTSIPAFACKNLHVEHYGEVGPSSTHWHSVIRCHDTFSHEYIALEFAKPLPEHAWSSAPHDVARHHDGKRQIRGFSMPHIQGEPFIIKTHTPGIAPPLLNTNVVQPIALRGVTFKMQALMDDELWVKQVRDVRQRDITLEEREHIRQSHPDLLAWPNAIIIHVRANQAYADAGGVAPILEHTAARPAKAHALWWLLLILFGPALYVAWRLVRNASREEEVQHFLNTHSGDLP